MFEESYGLSYDFLRQNVTNIPDKVLLACNMRASVLHVTNWKNHQNNIKKNADTIIEEWLLNPNDPDLFKEGSTAQTLITEIEKEWVQCTTERRVAISLTHTRYIEHFSRWVLLLPACWLFVPINVIPGGSDFLFSFKKWRAVMWQWVCSGAQESGPILSRSCNYQLVYRHRESINIYY